MPNMDLIQLKAKELHYNIDSWLYDSNDSIVSSKSGHVRSIDMLQKSA